MDLEFADLALATSTDVLIHSETSNVNAVVIFKVAWVFLILICFSLVMFPFDSYTLDINPSQTASARLVPHLTRCIIARFC